MRRSNAVICAPEALVRVTSMNDMTANPTRLSYSIRPVRADQCAAVGELLVQTYSALPVMLALTEHPDYYARLRDVALRAANSAITVYVAVSAAGELLGSVDFIEQMEHYGSGGVASRVSGAAGIRFLAVAPVYR